MANEKGHWVTVNGRHIFFSDDPYEKQEKEIADSQKRASEYNKSRQDKSDPVETNPYYRGLAEDAKKVLSAKDSDFESLDKKYTDLYEIIGKFNKYGVTTGDTYNALQKELKRVEAVTNMGYVNTGRYDSELKKVNDKRAAQHKADEDRKANVAKLKKEHPHDYVSNYGIVLEGHNRSLADLKKAAGTNTEVHFVDGRAESAKAPAGTIDVQKGWKGISNYNFDDSLEWGWFTDTDGKRKIWFYLSD